MKFSLAILAALALLPAAGWTDETGQADPADPGLVVPLFKYESAFRGFVSRQDDAEVADWRSTGIDKRSPTAAGMNHMRMQPAPAQLQSQPRRDDGGSSGHDMQRMRKM